MERLCFIFPNRRSMAFFHSKWLAGAVKAAGKPVISPQMLTMNDFFCRVSGVCVTDRVSLLLTLHECYRSVNEKAESLDDFIFWGDMILSDFDDTDKYLASPRNLFANVADFRKMQDDMSYLSEAQKEAMTRFMEHFRTPGRMPAADSHGAKGRFLMMWNLMYPLYEEFNKVLKSKNMAYEGMAYREFAGRLGKESVGDILKETFPLVDKFVFVGLNALNECERKVMGKMRDASLAEFCWDFSSSMIRDPQNRSAMFMSRNVRDFPQAFEIDPGIAGKACPTYMGQDVNMPDINVISVSSATGQVKYLPHILSEIRDRNGDAPADWSETAVVLPDEGLLIPVLNTIPPYIEDINVTMGCPMSGSGIYALMNQVMALQIHLRMREGKCSFYHRQVWQIMSSGVVRAVMGEEAVALAARIKKEARLYVLQEDLASVWPFNVIFRPVLTDPKLASDIQIKALEEYQLEILGTFGAKLSGMGEMSLETHFAKQYYLCVNRLKGLTLNILPVTYMRLLQQLAGTVTVPFNGEPLKGLQIMGPLESRALDFKNIVIFSCNEGVFPRRSVSSSFIPPELRKGFGLPTYENQDAVWAYYFYRMIQRPEKVWLVYDSRTEGLKSGEESRYIKQLEYLYRYPKLTRSVIRSRVDTTVTEDSVKKDDNALKIIRSMTFSASAVRKYLSCPASFYYSSVLKLKPESEVQESMDGGMVGNVFHNTMYALYTGGDARLPDFDMSRDNVREKIHEPLKFITDGYVRSLMSGKGMIRDKIRALIRKELNTDEISGRNLVMENVINRYVMKTLECDLKLMKDNSVDRFSIIGLEMEWHWTFAGFRFNGFIDRMDSIHPGTVRIVDYKTGRHFEDNEVNINDDNAEQVAEGLFGQDVKDRPGIAFQMYLYDRFAREGNAGHGENPLKRSGPIPDVENVIYHIPSLFISGPVASRECVRFDEIVSEKLSGLMSEISDPDTGFRRTSETSVCSYCDFRKICGR